MQAILREALDILDAHDPYVQHLPDCPCEPRELFYMLGEESKCTCDFWELTKRIARFEEKVKELL